MAQDKHKTAAAAVIPRVDHGQSRVSFFFFTQERSSAQSTVSRQRHSSEVLSLILTRKEREDRGTVICFCRLPCVRRVTMNVDSLLLPLFSRHHQLEREKPGAIAIIFPPSSLNAIQSSLSSELNSVFQQFSPPSNPLLHFTSTRGR